MIYNRIIDVFCDIKIIQIKGIETNNRLQLDLKDKIQIIEIKEE